MTSRIQQALDGELPRDRLRPDELAELEAYEEAVDRALAPVRGEPTVDLSAAVMSRVDAAPRHRAVGASRSRWRRGIEWLLAPRPVTLRPAWGLAAAALAVILIAGPWRGEGAGGVVGPEAPVVAAETPDAPTVVVRFTLQAPDANAVQLAGDFTGWQPAISMTRGGGGIWTVEVPVRTGVHQYSFVVDGERWVPDPAAPRVDDGFGGSNSRLDVLPPAEDREL